MTARPPDFDLLYTADTDPWQVGTSEYEQRKLGVVLASLLRPRYAFAWDPACGTGHLARRLAERCDEVLATDASPRAVELATEHGRGVTNIRYAGGRLPVGPPPGQVGRPDLVVLSEFFYYLDDRERSGALAMLNESTAPAAELLAVHWRHVPHDAWLSGAGVQAEIVARLAQWGWSTRVHHVEDDFVIDSLTRGARP